MPRSLAYCDRTVRADAPINIGDASDDAEFAGNPFLDLVGLPFYAGVPLHSSDGRAVGTLCIVDDEARADFDPDDLQQFVEAAETTLQSFEPDVAEHATSIGPAFLNDPHKHEHEHEHERDSLALRTLARLLQSLLQTVLAGFLRRQARSHWDNRAVTVGASIQRPLRVLVFGAGFAVGYGSDGGATRFPLISAPLFTAASGRGVIVETRARPSVPLEHCLELLGPAGAAGFDHVIFSPTLEEALRGSSRRWIRELQRIIAAVQNSGPSQVRVTLLGLPLVDGNHVLQRVGRVLGGQVNSRIAAAARKNARTSFLAVPNRTLATYETPMFDTAYRSEVTALLTHHLLRPAQVAQGSPSAPLLVT